MGRLVKICVWMFVLMSLLGLSACAGTRPENPAQQPVDAIQPGEPTQSVSETQPNNLAPEASSQPGLPTAAATNVEIDCAGADIHPIGQSIAETYNMPYEQVMTWFCSGYSFDNILIALETSQAVDIPADTLLQMILDKEWEEVWAEVGFVDNP